MRNEFKLVSKLAKSVFEMLRSEFFKDNTSLCVSLYKGFVLLHDTVVFKEITRAYPIRRLLLL